MATYLINPPTPRIATGAIRATTVAMILGATLVTGSTMADGLTSNEHGVDITINEIAMLDFDNAAPVAFEIVAPENAGESPVVSATDTTRRLFFTSIVNQQGETRNITVAHDNNVPDGLRLHLHASGPTGSGNLGTTNGNFSSPAVITDLGTQVVVNGIGSGYTNTGSSDGVALDYSLSILSSPQDLASLAANSSAVTLTYTMGVQ